MNEGQKVRLVRFVGHLAIGKELEMCSYLEDGQRLREYRVALSAYNETFLEVKLDAGALTYSQLVPWAAVATVMLPDVVKKATK